MKQLILLLVVTVLVGHSQAQGNRKCAQNGEYCLTHSECCSGSCLSFSYKCVPVPPGAQVGTTFVPVVVDTANRFGGPDDGGASITQKTCAKNGEYCLTEAECCPGFGCLSFSYKCVPLQPGSTQSQASRPPPPPSRPSSSSSNGGAVDTGNRVGEDDTMVQSSSGTTTARPANKCAAVGEYCLLSAECCSGACLSYAYKCVTNPRLEIPGQDQQPVSPTGTTSVFSNRIDANSDSSTTTTTTAVAPTPPKKCAAVGEYCLTAADCCSRSCLSFSYKCVNNYDLGGLQITQSGIPVQVPSTGGTSSTNNNNDVENRFGGGSDNQCYPNGNYCFHSGECCSRACYKSICSTRISLGIPESELTRPSVANGPYVQVNSLDELITRFGGGGGSAAAGGDSSASATSKQQKQQVGNRSGTGKQCAVVGEGCSRQEDCCSMRCHSYRRKCVT